MTTASVPQIKGVSELAITDALGLLFIREWRNIPGYQDFEVNELLGWEIHKLACLFQKLLENILMCTLIKLNRYPIKF